jgi:hypothetical protein
MAVPPHQDEDGVVIETPTDVSGVVLGSLQTMGGRDEVELRWETVSELQITGFNIRRRVGEHGDCVQLNDAFIFAEYGGADMGAPYRFHDATVEPGVKHCYLLEVMLRTGIVVNHRLPMVHTRWWLELPLILRR